MSFLFRITGPDSTQVYAIPLGTTTIGRESSREIVLAHPLVSRLHAQLTCSEQECQIVDLGSANGTLVGEEVLTPQVPYVLQPGDKLTIGPFELVFKQAQVETQAEAAASDDISDKEPEPGEAVHAAAEELAPGPRQASKAKRALASAPPDAAEQAAPPSQIPPVPPELPLEEPDYQEETPVPPGLSIYSRQLLQYLPGIYNTDFMSRFLALFESILVPIEWNVDNFDLFLSPGTSPVSFLPWLARWFEITYDDSWSEAQRRALLIDAHRIFARHGTRWALARVLEIYTGYIPEIADTGQDIAPHTFLIRFPFPKDYRKQELLERIVEAHKPAHTTYALKFKGQR
jgi:phage tail-like protein